MPHQLCILKRGDAFGHLYISDFSHSMALEDPYYSSVAVWHQSHSIFCCTPSFSSIIGSNVLLAYSGLATVIHARCRIGDRVLISQGVTLGGRSGLFEVPVIEDDVQIGAGAKILGPIVIGRGAKIGANAVVLQDVPAGATFVGIPAHDVNSVNA